MTTKFEPMYVIKRNGKKEPMMFDKISNRISKLNYNLEGTDPSLVTQKVASRIFSGIKTSELDEITSQTCMSLVIEHPDYGILGSRITISNHQKNTTDDFVQAVETLYNNVDILGEKSPLVSERLLNLSRKHKNDIEKLIDYQRDYDLDYFGFKTLEKGYLLKLSSGEIIERPQHLFLRVAIGIHWDEWEDVVSCYENLSRKNYTYATPALFHAGTNRSQLASCFLLPIEDSLEGIMKCYHDVSTISKHAGGIGVHVSNIRSKGSYIRGTGGFSSGLLPMLRTFNSLARQFDQSSRRNGSFAIYLEPHHADVMTFLEAKRNQGVELERARDLFYALWVSDLFMECVRDDKDWYLMDPNRCKNLNEVYGDEYKTLYYDYVSKNMYEKKIKSRDLFSAIVASQIEQGMPYIGYKDHVNRKSNQKNIGIIKSSNLCAEINLVSTPEETAVCNLASICLPNCVGPSEKMKEYQIYKGLEADKKLLILFIPDCTYCKLLKSFCRKYEISYEEITLDKAKELLLATTGSSNFETYPQVFSESSFSLDNLSITHIGGYTETWNLLKPEVDFNKLALLAYDLALGLNKVIDTTFYPTEEAERSNMNHRPIGIGVQGLADVFYLLKIPYTSPEARRLNKQIFETIYYGAINASIFLAKFYGYYSSFDGSPLSIGNFQFNLWDIDESELMHDWKPVREEMIRYGTRNSTLIALMPTASTSQIFGNTESFEPLTSNVYSRRTRAGEFTIVNKYLLQDLNDLGLWTNETRDRLIYDRGSVQSLKSLPKFLRDVYKTVWETSQKELIEMSAERGPFVCQSQSFNLYFDNPNFTTLLNAHFHGWKNGLKTGSYYIRTKPGGSAQRFGMDITKEKEFQKEEDEGCINCSA